MKFRIFGLLTRRFCKILRWINLKSLPKITTFCGYFSCSKNFCKLNYYYANLIILSIFQYIRFRQSQKNGRKERRHFLNVQFSSQIFNPKMQVRSGLTCFFFITSFQTNLTKQHFAGLITFPSIKINIQFVIYVPDTDHSWLIEIMTFASIVERD